MRTTLNIEDELFNKATKLTGVSEKTSLVRLGLEALIARESGKRLAKLEARKIEEGSPQKDRRNMKWFLLTLPCG